MSRRRVVITGLGAVSPVGNTVEECWSNLLKGQSGISSNTKFDASAVPARIAGEVRNLDVGSYLSGKEIRRMDSFIHFGMIAGIQAFNDSGLTMTEEVAYRIGVNIGYGIGGLPMIEETNNDFNAGGHRKI